MALSFVDMTRLFDSCDCPCAPQRQSGMVSWPSIPWTGEVAPFGHIWRSVLVDAMVNADLFDCPWPLKAKGG